MKIKIKVVDAFTNVRFKGNPAAVVISGKWLSDEKMQEIAACMFRPIPITHFGSIRSLISV